MVNCGIERSFLMLRFLRMLAISIAAVSIFSLTVSGQTLLSKFDFDALPLMKAGVGPDGTSVNTTAKTDGNGMYFSSGGGTTGLDLVVPSSSFNLPSMSVHFEYSRNESTGYLFDFGGMSIYVTGGDLYFDYVVYKNKSKTTSYSLGPIPLPVGQSGVFDDVWCSYDAATGIGRIVVNGIVRDSVDATNNRNLYWVGAGDITIGRILDGGGNGFVTLGSVSIYDAYIAHLPVELTSFAALRREDGVELVWNTATEVNNYGFDIERSHDGEAWETIGFVHGYGTVHTPRDYSFSDRDLLQQRVPRLYYRLKQRDRDGTYAYSKTVFIETASANRFTVHDPYPNPFKAETSIAVTVDESAVFEIAVYDAIGRQVAVVLPMTQLSAGMHQYLFEGHQLNRGVYFVIVTAGTERISRKLIVQ